MTPVLSFQKRRNSLIRSCIALFCTIALIILTNTAHSAADIKCNSTCTGEIWQCTSGEEICYSVVLCCDVEDLPCTEDETFRVDCWAEVEG